MTPLETENSFGPFVWTLSSCSVMKYCCYAVVYTKLIFCTIIIIIITTAYDKCGRHYSVTGPYMCRIETLRYSPGWDTLVGIGVCCTVFLFKMGTGLYKFVELNLHFTYLWVQNGLLVPVIWPLFCYQDEMKQLDVKPSSCVEVVPTIQIRGLYLLLLYQMCELGQLPCYSRLSYHHVLPEEHDKK